MPEDTAAATDSSQTPSDPYVIYQLRKPSQRGTAVIPRFVPNTHAPAFSPANYRFARVWATADTTSASPSSLLHVPRSFEYAGSLGSESSFWSETSSWISSLRTAPSEGRTPLLQPTPAPVSAASFFNNDFDNNRLRNTINQASSARSSDLESSVRGSFRYPPALSESVSEDAVVDDLLSMPRHPPRARTSSASNHDPSIARKSDDRRNSHRSSDRRNSSQPHHNMRSAPTTSPSGGSNTRSLLPALTRKRRSLWQWLFCSDNATPSSVPSAAAVTAQAMREKMRSTTEQRTGPPPAQSRQSTQRDRVPNADKEFISRGRNARDATGEKRSPSFEIRRGKPDASGNSRRSLSWSLMPRGLFGLDRGDKDGKKNGKEKKRKNKFKDRARGISAEDAAKEEEKANRIVFQKVASRKQLDVGRDPTATQERRGRQSNARRDASSPQQKDHVDKTREASRKAEKMKEERRRAELRSSDRPREDRPREDRPRDTTSQLHNFESGGSGHMQKSVVPSLREKVAIGNARNQRMRSAESTDPVTSRISSDLSNGSYGRRTGSDSGHSANSQALKYQARMHELDPAANGVSSDVSSHISGPGGKLSPVRTGQQELHQVSSASSPDIAGVDVNLGSPFRSKLFAFPSSSSESGGFIDQHQKTAVWESPPTASYPEYASTGSTKPLSSDSAERSASTPPMLDSIARAREKNRARSAGGPLSYLMKHHEAEGDINTGSTGLTSLADESVTTHHTVGEDYIHRQPHGYRNLYGEQNAAVAMRPELHEKEMAAAIGTTRPIFQNSALFSRSSRMSPRSGGASPRRFHSDWSDPHATDIDVYCQCNCSCVYEEECRRSCELIFGRSPSVSSTRSCSRKGYPGFKSLPPAMDSNGVKQRLPQSDTMGINEEEPTAFMNERNGGQRETVSKPQKTIIRASAVDELPDVPPSPHSKKSSRKIRAPGHGNGEDGEHMQQPTSGRSGDQSFGEGSWKPGQYEPVRRDHRWSQNGQGSRESYGRQHNIAPNGYGHIREDHGTARSSTPRPTDVVRTVNGHSRYRSPLSHEHEMIDEEQKRSSRRSSVRSGGSSQRGGSSGRRDEPLSGGSKEDSFGVMMSTDRKRRESEYHGKYRPGYVNGYNPRLDAGRQMGNSYVVKRSGLPPSTQAIPQPYRSRDMGGEIGEDDKDAHGGWADGRDGHDGYDSSDMTSSEAFGTGGLDEFGSKRMSRTKSHESSGGRASAREKRGDASMGENGYDRRAQRKSESGHAKKLRGHATARAKDEERDGMVRGARHVGKMGGRTRTPLFGFVKHRE